MEAKTKQQWTHDETECFLGLWTSSEIQDQLEGSSRIKPVFEKIQSDMAAAGYDRSLDQLLNKLKKLKKEYRDSKRQHGRSGRAKRIPHFDLLDPVLRNRPMRGGKTRARNRATAAVDLLPETVDQSSDQTVTNGTELLSMDEEADSELPLQPLICSSPTPSCSASSTSSSFLQTRAGKRRRNSTSELIEYLDRSEERFMEQTRRDQDLTAALLENIQRMDETANTLVGLMGRMVSVMEGLSQK